MTSGYPSSKRRPDAMAVGGTTLTHQKDPPGAGRLFTLSSRPQVVVSLGFVEAEVIFCSESCPLGSIYLGFAVTLTFNPLQCSCLENPRDGEAWWAAVSGVAQSRTRLK